MRPGWANRRATLVGNRRPGYAAASRSVRRRSPSLRSAPAAARARCGDGPRRRAAGRHPAATRACEPWESPASTSRGSIAAKSSTPSTGVPRPCCLPAAAFANDRSREVPEHRRHDHVPNRAGGGVTRRACPPRGAARRSTRLASRREQRTGVAAVERPHPRY